MHAYDAQRKLVCTRRCVRAKIEQKEAGRQWVSVESACPASSYRARGGFYLGALCQKDHVYGHVWKEMADALMVTALAGWMDLKGPLLRMRPVQVSKLNSNKNATVSDIVKDMGMYNLATRGLGLRIIMVGTLTGLQWGIYDGACRKGWQLSLRAGHHGA